MKTGNIAESYSDEVMNLLISFLLRSVTIVSGGLWEM